MSAVPTLAVLGTVDECLPSDLGRERQMKRLLTAMGGTAQGVLVDGASHLFTNREQSLADVLALYVQHNFALPAEFNIDKVQRVS